MNYKKVKNIIYLSIALIVLITSPVFADLLTFVEVQKDSVNGVNGLNGPRSITVSPDGKHVYVVGDDEDAVAVFSRDSTTGALTFLQVLSDVVNIVDGQITISPNGKHVYATGMYDDIIAVFSRNSVTGELTFIEVQKDGVNGVDGLHGAYSVTVSPDEKHVYVGGADEDAVAVFNRDSVTGKLTFIEVQKDDVNGVDGLNGCFSVVVSSDGKNVYVASVEEDAVAVFSRNSVTGELTFIEVQKDGVNGVDGLRMTTSVTVSPDGKNAYATGVSESSNGGVSMFYRDLTTGKLTFGEIQEDGVNGVDGIDGSFSVTVSPNGKYVYVAGFRDDAVALFWRDSTTGVLTFVERQKDYVHGVDGLEGSYSVTVSPDEKHVYVAGYNDNAIAVFKKELYSVYLDNNQVTVYEVPYAFNDQDNYEELGRLFADKVVIMSLKFLWELITDLPIWTPFKLIKWYEFALNFFDILTDPIRIVPVGKVSDPTKYEGNPAVNICDTGSVSAIVLLDFAGTGGNNWDMGGWDPLYLRLWSWYNIGTIFDERVLLTSEQMRSLDPSKSYIVVPKVTLDTSKIEGSPKPWLRAQAMRRSTAGYNYYEGDVILLFSDALCSKPMPWIPLLLQ